MVDGRRVSPSLRACNERLRALLERPLDTPTRYAIGALVHEVKRAPDTYGGGAVMQLAASTGADLATLYRYASVAACWTLDEVTRLSAPRGAYVMSWSHLVAIANVADAGERVAWIERCRGVGLSLRQLEALLAAASAEPESGRETLGRIERTLGAAERLIEQAAELEAMVSPDALPPALLDRAIALHERMRSTAERQLRALRRLPAPPRSGSFARILDGPHRAASGKRPSQR
jgi:hypothetical protein